MSKITEADLQALQASNGVLTSVDQNVQGGQVVMMDDGGNLVEGVVQMQDGTVATSDGNVIQLPVSVAEALQDGKVVNEAADILANLNDIQGLDPQNLINSVMKSTSDVRTSPSKPIKISSSVNTKSRRTTVMTNGEVVSIKVNTGVRPRVTYCSPNAIKISTITGQQKSQTPKFHKCDACSINFVSKIAHMNHMENCPSIKRKMATPLSGKSNITYTCVFCESKFNSRLVLMQHVRTCEKAKSTKNVMNPKLKVTTSESKLGDSSTKKSFGRTVNSKESFSNHAKMDRFVMNKKSKESFLDPDDPGYGKDEEDSSDDDKNIPYDDDEDYHDEDLHDGEEVFNERSKKSQKYLGPIVTKGMFQCRDCNRTFSKENQYNRHVKGCSSTPLNTTRIVNDVGSQNSTPSKVNSDSLSSFTFGKRKRVNEFDTSNNKKRAVAGSNKKSSSLVNILDTEKDSDEDLSDYFSSGATANKGTGSSASDSRNKTSKIHSSINKIVKISPSDKLVKQTGKAVLSSMNNQQKSFRKSVRDFPVCGLCGDKFTSVEDVSNHTKVSHFEDLVNVRDILDGKGNLGTIKCPLCDFYFLSSKSLLCHLVVTHNNELRSAQDELDSQNMNLACPFCSNLSFSQDLLREHLATSHLNQFCSKTTITPSPSTSVVDVESLLKEKPTVEAVKMKSKIENNVKTISCPDCSLVFTKPAFQNHKCAAIKYSPSAKKFICSEQQCSSMSFYKLIHLLTHLQQVSINIFSENKNLEHCNNYKIKHLGILYFLCMYIYI